MQCSIGPLGDSKCANRKERGEQCWSNYECPEKLTCRSVGPSKKSHSLNYCLKPLADGKFCKRDSDCKSEVCLKRSRNKTKVCRDQLPLGSVCDNSKHCTQWSRVQEKEKGLHSAALSAGVLCR